MAAAAGDGGTPGGLAAYVTSHGFGHLNRSVAVLNRVPTDVPLTIRCHPDLFPSWRQRLTRPANLEDHVSDAGAVNPPGDSAATDGPATLARAAEVHAQALAKVDEEAQRLRFGGAAAVLCDAPPLPLVAAQRAGIPGFLLANFTWADIYAPHARKAGGDAPRLVHEIRRAYRAASTVFRAEPALKLSGIAPVIEVGLVVTPGQDRRAELRQQLNIPPADRLVYFYVGRYGQASMGFERLGRIAGVHFVTFHRPPGPDVPNIHIVPPGHWTGADLAASTDAMVAKAGYGTVTEAMAAGTPLIYPPRVGFAEHRALDQSLRLWGGGVPISARVFDNCQIGPALGRAFALRPGPPPFPLNGAETVAAYLTDTCRGHPARG